MQAELVLDIRAQLGEGPNWDIARQKLWWIDGKKQKVCLYNPTDGSNIEHDLGHDLGTVVRREKGGLLVARANGVVTLNAETGALEHLCDPEEHLPENRFNDGKCDPAGRFWFGSMENAEVNMDRGSLYCLDLDGTVEKKLEPVGISNGIVWTADKSTVYYIDSPTRRVDAFDYDDASGAISNRRTAFELPDGIGFPDGMSIDNEDKLWIALWDGFAVGHFDPLTGDLLGKVDVPVPHVSACAFGGPAMDELYITTARHLMEDHELTEYPQSGGLFHAHVGVRGVPFEPYRG